MMNRLTSVLLVLLIGVGVAAYAVPLPVFAGNDHGSVTVSDPSKDGKDTIQIRFKEKGPDGKPVTATTGISASADLNGKPRNSSDDPQDTAQQKANKLCAALDLELQIENLKRVQAGQPVLGMSFDCQGAKVTVTIPGGAIVGGSISGTTQEKYDTITVNPDGTQIALGEVTFGGTISGVAGDSGASEGWVVVGGATYSVSTVPGMSQDEFLSDLEEMLQVNGVRASRYGRSGLTVMLPSGNASFGAGSNDAALTIGNLEARIL